MIEVWPATSDRFSDLAVILGPGNPATQACWCLSYRIPHQEFSTLSGAERPDRLRRYAEEGTPPGVIAYLDGEPAGWCSAAPRASHHRLLHSRTIPAVDEKPVWSVVCFVISRRFRGRGLSRDLLGGAIDYAQASKAPVLEGYPVDSGGGRISSAFAYTGTTALFESAGFERAAQTTSKSGGRTRWVMRRQLAG